MEEKDYGHKPVLLEECLSGPRGPMWTVRWAGRAIPWRSSAA